MTNGESEDFMTSVTKEKLAKFGYSDLLHFWQLTTRYVVLDTEATGLGNDHAITEIGAIEIENMQRTGNKFQVFLNPEREVCASAHKITGYTWKQLSKHPIFQQIAPHFLQFLKKSPLVIHNQHYDLKLINESLSAMATHHDKIENNHIIIDTQPFAKMVLPNNKIGLRSLAQHFDIECESINNKHNALFDAELLADVFVKLIKLNKGQLPRPTLLSQIPPCDLTERFQAANDSFGVDLFHNLGINLPLPQEFRYSFNMFHPDLLDNYPAILVKFYNQKKIVKGILVRFDVNNQPLKYENSPLKKSELPEDKRKLFFGVAEDSTTDIHPGSADITFIGDLMSSLITRELLLGDQSSIFLKNLEISSGFTIKACLDLMYLPTITFDIKTRRVIILVDYTSTNDTQLNSIMLKMIDKYYYNQFVGLFNKIKQQTELVGYIIKHNEQDWSVINDKYNGELRCLTVSRENEASLDIVVNVNEKTIFINECTITQPNSLLISPPKITLEIIALTTEADNEKSALQMWKKHKETLEKRFYASIQIKSIKDLQFIHKIELAKKLYDQALTIRSEDPVAQYFIKRGITMPLPESFRWMSNVFHPWVDRSLPLTLVPLYNEKNVIVGVHRLFCDQDGSILKYCPNEDSGLKKLPFKLSLGRTVGTSVEIFRDTINNTTSNKLETPRVLLISEGIENALVARDTCINIKQNHPDFAKTLFEALQIKDTYSISACVGINGLIDIPIEKETHTIVILADNDDVNPDAKQTIINTVKHFLKRNLKVLIVLPTKTGGGKVDLNDLFMDSNSHNKYITVANVMKEAIEIFNISELGSNNNIPLEVTLRDLYESRKRSSNPEGTSEEVNPSVTEIKLTKNEVKRKDLEENLTPIAHSQSNVVTPERTQKINTYNDENKQNIIPQIPNVSSTASKYEISLPKTSNLPNKKKSERNFSQISSEPNVVSQNQSSVDILYLNLISDPLWKRKN